MVKDARPEHGKNELLALGDQRVDLRTQVSRVVSALKLTSRNIDEVSATQEGRAFIRERVLDATGRVTLNRNAVFYDACKIHHLYRHDILLVNGRVAIYGQGVQGSTYYYRDDVERSKRVIFRTGDVVLPQKIESLTLKPMLGLNSADEQRLKSYSKFRFESHDANVVNRTFPHRFRDQEYLLRLLLQPHEHSADIANAFTASGVSLQKLEPVLDALRKKLFPTRGHKSVFFDIGPGLANVDTRVMAGKGIPAVTSQEMAKLFPQMPIFVVDLPEQAEIFMGKKQGSDSRGNKFTVSEAKRNEFLAHSNLHIIQGNGLESLAIQVKDSRTNPIPARIRPHLEVHSTLIVRMCNSVDIYCNWDKKNGSHPSVRETLARLADDYEAQPILLFFNREILVKVADSKQWEVFGKVSPAGFNHNTRTLSRAKQQPFSFY